MKCESPQIYRQGYRRKSYTRKNGTRVRSTYVPGSCIRSTRSPKYKGQKRASWAKQVQKKLRHSHRIARQKYGTPKCKKGYIVKEGYVRKSYRRGSYRRGSKKISGTRVGQTIVPPKCIKSRGRPGKGSPLIGPLKKGTLSQFGYHSNLSTESRHTALKKAVRELEWLPVYRKLNAIYVLSRRTNPQASRIFKQDRDWVKKMHYSV